MVQIIAGRLTLKFSGCEADPLQCRVRGMGIEPARFANHCCPKRGCAGATQSIAGSTSRACASGTLGVKFGMCDFRNLTAKVSGLPKASPLERQVRSSGGYQRIGASLGFLIVAARSSSIFACVRIGISLSSPVVVTGSIPVRSMVRRYISSVFAGVTRDVVLLGRSVVAFVRAATRTFSLYQGRNTERACNEYSYRCDDNTLHVYSK